MRAATLLVIGALGVWAGCSTAVHSAGGEMDGFDRIVLPAEASGYLATSTYDDVMRVLDQVERRTAAFSEPVRQTTFGATAEGRGLPLMVWGASGTSLQAIRESDKARVLVVGNIHAGEVAGKDALLELLRDVTEGEHVAWTDSLVVLIAPIYNADGNERFDLDNRRLQDGPERGMGQRPNAAGLDLNRDFMKVASPEARALVGLIRDVDPHLVVDLHTTNGTHMGYHLTYAPGLSPNTPSAIDADLRDRWLPAISETLLATDDFATYHYGNVPGAFGEEATAPRGWYTFSPQPRFATNYVGLRGRYAILSEAYSYAPFEERVAVSHRFTEEILDQAWADASRMRQRVEEADRQPVAGTDVALRATWAPLAEPVDILLGEVDTLRHPVSGEPVFRRRDVRQPERMPAYIQFEPTESVVAPSHYLVMPPAEVVVTNLLDLHGIAYERIPMPDRSVSVEVFRIDSTATAARVYQGQRQRTVFGAWEALTLASTSSGSPLVVSVPVDQPLGRLAVMLLEPRADDGAFAWGLLPDASYEGTAPIWRIPSP